jgi:hypothetical protein
MVKLWSSPQQLLVKNTNNGVTWGFLWDLATEYLAHVVVGGEEHQLGQENSSLGGWWTFGVVLNSCW